MINYVHRNLGVAISKDGEQIPIVTWVDDQGEDCELEEAVVCIAGPDEAGKWHTIDLRQFTQITAH